MRRWPDQCVQICVTSPPYWGLRDYGVSGQLGLEATPAEYVEKMVAVFREVRRVLRDDGTLWLNLGDIYARDPKKGNRAEYLGLHKNIVDSGCHTASQARTLGTAKSKDLIGIPWRVAFALQADGWYLRQDIIWAKPNPMPESVRDRCTKSHEYIFMLSKNERYYYDADAIRTPYAEKTKTAWGCEFKGNGDNTGLIMAENMAATIATHGPAKTDKQRGHSRRHAGFNDRWDAMTKEEQSQNGANKRDVWTVATKPYKEAHFATFPPALIEPCILAGSRPGDVVLDPFMGSGTTAMVAQQHGRKYRGCELQENYRAMQIARIGKPQVVD